MTVMGDQERGVPGVGSSGRRGSGGPWRGLPSAYSSVGKRGRVYTRFLEPLEQRRWCSSGARRAELVWVVVGGWGLGMGLWTTLDREPGRPGPGAEESGGGWGIAGEGLAQEGLHGQAGLVQNNDLDYLLALHQGPGGVGGGGGGGGCSLRG